MALQAAFTSNCTNSFNTNIIDLGKLPASCSGILQASDVSPLFKSVKSRVAAVIRHNTLPQNPILAKNIKAFIRNFETHYSIKLSSEHIDKICVGCVTVVRAIQDMSNPSKIIEGFKTTGQYPLDYFKLMNQCYKKATLEELTDIRKHETAHIAAFRENGMVPGEELELSEIPTNTEKERDNLPIHNQRAALITHENIRERHIERINSGMPLGNSIVDCQNRQDRMELQRAAKLIQSMDARAKKTNDERIRKAQMTPEEKAAEKEAKRLKSIERKAEKTNRVEQARNLLVQYQTEI